MDETDPTQGVAETGPGLMAMFQDWLAIVWSFIHSLSSDFIDAGPLTWVSTGVGALVILAGFLGWFRGRRKTKNREAADAARHEAQAKADADARARAEAERAAMATEMHDMKAMLATFVDTQRTEAAARGEAIDEDALARTGAAALDIAGKSPEAETATEQFLSGDAAGGLDTLFVLAHADTSRTRQSQAETEDRTHQSAAFWTRIGDLAYMNHTQKALEAYQQAVALDTSNAHVWNKVGALNLRLGSLAEADTAFTHVLETAGADGKTWQAAVLGNLGLIARKRGDLDKAEDYHQRALVLLEEIGHKEHIAATLGNLGLIARKRGDLDKAENYHQRALALNEALGSKEGMACDHGNLGSIAQMRGDLDKAEDYHQQALAIDTELGRKEGMAAALGNLGLIAQTRGDLGKAEDYLKRALALLEEIGHKEHIAAALGNLGLIAQTRNELAEACRLWGEALALYEEIGMPHMVEQVSGWMKEAGCGAGED